MNKPKDTKGIHKITLDLAFCKGIAECVKKCHTALVQCLYFEEIPRKEKGKPLRYNVALSDGYCYFRAAFCHEASRKIRDNHLSKYDIILVNKYLVSQLTSQGTTLVMVTDYERRISGVKRIIGKPVYISDYRAAKCINPFGQNIILYEELFQDPRPTDITNDIYSQFMKGTPLEITVTFNTDTPKRQLSTPSQESTARKKVELRKSFTTNDDYKANDQSMGASSKTERKLNFDYEKENTIVVEDELNKEQEFVSSYRRSMNKMNKGASQKDNKISATQGKEDEKKESLSSTARENNKCLNLDLDLDLSLKDDMSYNSTPMKDIVKKDSQEEQKQQVEMVLSLEKGSVKTFSKDSQKKDNDVIVPEMEKNSQKDEQESIPSQRVNSNQKDEKDLAVSQGERNSCNNQNSSVPSQKDFSKSNSYDQINVSNKIDIAVLIEIEDNEIDERLIPIINTYSLHSIDDVPKMLIEKESADKDISDDEDIVVHKRSPPKEVSKSSDQSFIYNSRSLINTPIETQCQKEIKQEKIMLKQQQQFLKYIKHKQQEDRTLIENVLQPQPRIEPHKPSQRKEGQKDVNLQQKQNKEQKINQPLQKAQSYQNLRHDKELILPPQTQTQTQTQQQKPQQQNMHQNQGNQVTHQQKEQQHNLKQPPQTRKYTPIYDGKAESKPKLAQIYIEDEPEDKKVVHPQEAQKQPKVNIMIPLEQKLIQEAMTEKNRRVTLPLQQSPFKMYKDVSPAKLQTKKSDETHNNLNVQKRQHPSLMLIPKNLTQSLSSVNQEKNSTSESQLQAQRIVPINSLSYLSNNWTIKARIINKNPIKDLQTKNGRNVKILSIDLLDRDGGEIEAVFFGGLCNTYYQKLQDKGVYLISDGLIKRSTLNQPNSRNELQIVFEGHADIKETFDDGSISMNAFKFSTIPEIQSKNLGDIIDIVGIIFQEGTLTEITGKTGDKVPKKSFSVYDSSCQTIEITLWGEYSTKVLNRDSVIILKNLKVNQYLGKRCLVSTPKTIIMTNHLPTYFKEVQKMIKVLEKKTVKIQVERSNFRRHLIGSLLETQSTMKTTEKHYFDVTASIIHIQSDMMSTFYYLSCPKDNCLKKVLSIGPNLYKCPSCCEAISDPKARYTLSMLISDFSGELWVNAFDVIGENILGCPAAHLQYLRDSEKVDDTEEFMRIMKIPISKEYNMRIMMKYEEFKGKEEWKSSILKISPLNFIEEARSTLQILNLYHNK